MAKQLRTLARHSLVYGIGSSLAAAGSFLLIPLYTHVLTPQEYGALELLYRIADILILVMFMGVRQAYIRFYFDDKDEGWQQTVTGTTVIFVLLSSVVIATVFYLLRAPVQEGVLKETVSDQLLLLVLAWVPFEMLIAIGYANLQVQMKSGQFVLASLARLVGFIVLNVLLVYVFRNGVAGVFTAQILVAVLIEGAILFFLVKWTPIRVSFPLMKELLRFGLPYLPAGFFMYAISNADRYFLSAYASLDALGIYALAYKLGFTGMLYIMSPFGLVWSPFLFENFGKPEGPALIGRVMSLYTLVILAVGLGVAVVAPAVIPLISGEAFHSADAVVPMLCLAAVFYGMANLADAGILVAKKTKYKPLVFGVGAAVAVSANFVLVPLLGIWGAALATMLSFLALLCVTWFVASRFYRVPLELSKFGLLFGAAGVTYAASLLAGRAVGEPFLSAGLSAATLLLFPVIVWLGGFFSVEERLAIRRFLRRPAADGSAAGG